MEIRKNNMTGEWVLIAENRAARPKVDSGVECPFCMGNEHLLPQYIYKSANGKIRVVENKYPAIDSRGVHEVVIDTDIHDEKLHEIPFDSMIELIHVLRSRYVEISQNKGIRYIQIFKNQGANAGASISHSHWQIIGLPFIPETQRRQLEVHEQHGACHICAAAEASPGRAVYENECIIVLCPEAPFFSYEMWVVPKIHIADITFMNNDDVYAFGIALKTALSALANILGNDAAYNICLYNSCSGSGNVHFYTQIIPRVGSLAGFELATGSYINLIPPEKAAAKLRRCLMC